MATDRIGQFLDDGQSFKALVDSMPETEREEYRSYGALNLESAFPNRRMVVYTLKGKEPVQIEMLLFGDLEVSRIPGPVVTVSDKQGEFSISTVPARYRKRDLFLHVPQHFELKWKGKQNPGGTVQFVPHYAVLVKSRSKEIHQIEGHTYCVTLNKFWERWPHLKNIRY